MIINDPVDRFASNFGVQPSSIALQADWTTPFDAVNVQENGTSFDEEKDFGYGLRGLGFENTGGGGEGNWLDNLQMGTNVANLLMWPLALFTVWQFFGKTKEGVKRKRAGVSKAKAALEKAKSKSIWS